MYTVKDADGSVYMDSASAPAEAVKTAASTGAAVDAMYDGMSCGHIALDKLGANITRYYATEIDKYAIQTTQTNYPETVQLGDAFQVRQWAGEESPCGAVGLP